MRKLFRQSLLTIISLLGIFPAYSQINTEQVMRIGMNTLYFDDYVLSIQYFNQVINVKPYLAQPYFYRSIAKLNLDDYLGAEQDATLAIERNPFITDAYEVRGVARQNLGKNRAAIEDYNKALELLPENRGLMYNKALAQHEIKDYDGASATYEAILRKYSNFDGGYLGRARLRLEKKDTVGAKNDIEKALSINKNAVNGYVMRADIAINSQKDYVAALDDMNQAIKLQPRYAGFFINRAFLRYMTDDFQGAFADYDYALQLEPHNTIALFNRGLMRAEVHDTNRAIDDFTTVLNLDGKDYKTLYNRAILLAEIGSFNEAIDDLNQVIDAFPDFAAAYFLRYDIKRRRGDMMAAQKDYEKSLALAKTKVQHTPDRQFAAIDSISASKSSDEVLIADDTDANSTGTYETQEEVKRRFSSLTTIADNSSPDQIYNNKEIRGKVQDRNITIEIEPIFVVSYYTSPTELKLNGDYIKEVDDVNATRILRFLLQVTNHAPAMTDEEVAQAHFNSIQYYNSYLAGHTPRAIDYLGRAMDFITLKDYENAIADLDRAINITPDFTLAYLLRANSRYLASKQVHDETAPTVSNGVVTSISPRRELRMEMRAIEDLDSVIKLSPTMPIAYYNKGVILAEMGDYTSALQAFTKAIELKPDFGEAYYNRGYVYLNLGNKDSAFVDLSRAGQLGIVPSYNLLKRMSSR